MRVAARPRKSCSNGIEVGGHAVGRGDGAQRADDSRRCGRRPSRRRSAPAAARRRPARSRRRGRPCGSRRGRSRRPCAGCRASRAVTSPGMRMARPGPGNGWRPTKLLGQAELAAERAHLVLEQLAQRLDQLQVHALRQAADIVVRLDRDRRAAGDAERSRSRRDRACPAPGSRRRRPCCASASNTSMNSRADGLALLLGIGDAGERAEEQSRGVDDGPAGCCSGRGTA